MFVTKDEYGKYISNDLLAKINKLTDAELEEIEKDNIDVIASYISTRYDVEKTFLRTGENRDGLLIQTIVFLNLHIILLSGNTLSINEDIAERHENTLKQLAKIGEGKMILTKADRHAEGTTKANFIYGGEQKRQHRYD